MHSRLLTPLASSLLLGTWAIASAFAQQLEPSSRVRGDADTLTVRQIDRPPGVRSLSDTANWGAPQIQVRTGQGTASVWLLRAADSVYVAAVIPDSTPYWGDDLVVSLDTEGDRADAPQHDDFQWYLRRALDSSVVYRGRAGRWEPPQGDPDWRLGRHHSAAGWDVRVRDGARGWTVILRLDAGWLGRTRTAAGLAVRVYDDQPGGWYSWPIPPPGVQPARVEGRPALWGAVRSTAPAARSGAAPRDAP